MTIIVTFIRIALTLALIYIATFGGSKTALFIVLTLAYVNDELLLLMIRHIKRERSATLDALHRYSQASK